MTTTEDKANQRADVWEKAARGEEARRIAAEADNRRLRAALEEMRTILLWPMMTSEAKRIRLALDERIDAALTVTPGARP